MTTVYMFNQYASYPGIPGSTRHFNLARELVRQGLDVYVFSSNFNHMIKRKIEDRGGLYFVENVEGVNYVRINTFEYFHNDWRRLANMLDYGRKSYSIALGLAEEGIRPGVIIGTVAHPFSVASAHIAGKKLNARFFIDIGDLWPEVFASSGKMTERHPVYVSVKTIMHHLYKKAEKIICLTEEASNYFEGMGLGSKTILMPPGIRINGNAPSDDVRPDRGEFRVIYAGSFQPIYPLDNVIRAAKLIEGSGRSNVRFTLIGDGTMKNGLKSLAAELGVGNVDFRDPMPKQELLEYLKNGSAFILIEKKASYGFPNKIIDYLSAGRPVIYASPVRHKILKSGCCIEARDDSPGSLAEAVVRLESMPEGGRRRMTALAGEYLRQNHDISVIARRLIEHLR